MSHTIKPASSSYRFTSDTSTLKNFEATPTAQRGFCTACGSLMYWRSKDPNSDSLSFTVGTVDPLYLHGEGADGVETGGNESPVPKEGYGLALASGEGSHWWCANEIKGVTDNIPFAGFGRGKKWAGDD